MIDRGGEGGLRAKEGATQRRECGGCGVVWDDIAICRLMRRGGRFASCGRVGMEWLVGCARENI